MDLNRVADAVVIGGGVVGASIAHYLADKGLTNVVILERNRVGSGATGKTSGLIRMHYTNPWDAALTRASLEVFQNWSDVIGGNCGFHRSGFLFIIGHQEIPLLQANVKMLQEAGVNTWIISPEDVKLMQPFMEVEDVGAAAYEPDSGYADGWDTANSLAQRAKDMGVEVRQGIEATQIVVEKGKVNGVMTSQGVVSAPTVILAAGPWSAPLALTAGIDLPVRGRRSCSGVLERPASIEDHMVVIDQALHLSFHPDAPNLTLFGVRTTIQGIEDGGADPDAYSTRAGQTDLANVSSRMIRRIPAMVDAEFKGTWAGVDGFTPDGHAILDKAPDVEGLYIAAGFSGTGFKTSPAVGKCMAELILEGKATTVDIDAFRLSRFAEGKPLVGEHEYAPPA